MTSSKENLVSETLLVYPWGGQGIQTTLTSGRAQSYLRWVMRQPNGRRLKYLDKVLGLRQHKFRNQYPAHLQRRGRENSNP
ncbi:MAG: hypothetical protein [Circular genetic element sp.]|nr:MAG: hypothetical protein [Circular genetic element sp.]